MFASKFPTANSILIEDANTGSSLIQELPKECNFGIVPISHGGIKKEIRFYNATGAMANGNIYIPKQATWLFDFEDSLMQFPNGSHDEDPDCLAQFLTWFKNNSIDWDKMFTVF
jgi:predicted phage terminase large subunit-like protein